MQLFPCPFCKERDEREFLYLGEAGKTRPDTTGTVSDEDWAAYLHDRQNAQGQAREIWMHLPCSEVFAMTRDTVTMAVAGATALRKDTP